jgi:hypothetical protein
VYKRCLPGAKVRVQGSCVYQGVAAPLVTVGPAGQRRQTERSILRPTTVIVFPATTAWFALRKLRPTTSTAATLTISRRLAPARHGVLFVD